MVKIIDGEDAEKFLEKFYSRDNSVSFGDLLNELIGENLKNSKSVTKNSIDTANNNLAKNNKIKISEDTPDDKTYHEPEWAITTKNLGDGKIATTIIVVAPFAVPKSICAKFDMIEDKVYGVKIDYDNTVFPTCGGNLDLRKHDSLRIGNFKKIDKKSVEITYNNGCYQINFCQVNNDKSEFTMGLSK